jgi:hypothetical protein
MSTPEPPPYPSGDNPENPDANPPGYPPPAPPPPPPGVPPQYGMPSPTVVPGSSKATTSLVTGIIGLFCCGIVLGPIAIITGKQASAEAAAAGLPQPGNAKAGIILGWIAIALMVLIIIFYGLLFALGAAGSFEPTSY